MATLDELYAHLWAGHGDDFAALDQSLSPRPWTFLFDLAAATGLAAHSLIADVGCGRGNHCFELARRFSSRVVGIDLVREPLRATALAEPPTPAVHFVQGSIEHLPLRTESVDFVWCRDMLVHVRNLATAARECRRILRPGGRMLTWVTVATERMDPREAQSLYPPLGIQAASLCRDQLEAAFTSAGFTIAQSEDLGSELIEFYEERDGRASRELMRIARMTRRRDQWLAHWGQLRYDAAYALYHWIVYHLLGKLSSGYYLLEK